MKIPPRVGYIHERFCGAMQRRYFIRAHMSAMLALVLIHAGVFGYEADRLCPAPSTAPRTWVF